MSNLFVFSFLFFSVFSYLRSITFLLPYTCITKEEPKKRAQHANMPRSPPAEDESGLLACPSTSRGSRRCTKTPVVCSGLEGAGTAALARRPSRNDHTGVAGVPNISKLRDITWGKVYVSGEYTRIRASLSLLGVERNDRLCVC